MYFIYIVSIWLATWRISTLFVSEDGPWKIFRKIREGAGIKHDDDGDPWEYPDNFFSNLLECVWCFSIWVGALYTGLFMISPYLSLILSLPFSASTVAIWIDNKMLAK